MSELNNSNLQKIYDLSKQQLLDRHNTEYESRLYPLVCIIKAYCAVFNLESPKELHRDFYAGNPEDGEAPIEREEKE